MRSSVTIVIAFGLAALAWFIWRPAGHSFFEVLGWIGSAGAAVFAAVSARATLATVQEMRLARQQEQRPQLTLNSGADNFQFCWPNLRGAPDDQVEPRFERYSGDARVESVGLPNFVLENFGGGAALDLEMSFKVEYADIPLSIPRHYKEIPFGSENIISLGRSSGNGKFGDLHLGRTYGGHNRTYGGHISPVNSVATDFRSHCGPGGKIEFQIPEHLCWYMALRAMQEVAQPRKFPMGTSTLTLMVEARYRSAVEASLTEVFAFEAQMAVGPHAQNGPPQAIWKDVSPPELRIMLDLVAKPRPPRPEDQPGRPAPLRGWGRFGALLPLREKAAAGG